MRTVHTLRIINTMVDENGVDMIHDIKEINITKNNNKWGKGSTLFLNELVQSLKEKGLLVKVIIKEVKREMDGTDFGYKNHNNCFVI